MFVDYKEINENQGKKKEYKVSFFSIKDGEQAIVRILVDKPDDIQYVSMHPKLSVGNKDNQRVDCIRRPDEPIENCPLCEAGFEIEQRAYIRMVQYTKDANGNIKAEGKIWDRSPFSDIITDIKQFLNTYGPLSNMICCISRKGSEFNNTKYTIAGNLPKEMYPDNIFVKDFSMFDDYSIMGSIIKQWSAEDMFNYVKTGKGPEKSNNEKPTFEQANVNTTFDNNDIPQWSVDQTPSTQESQNTGNQFNSNYGPGLAFDNQATSRPVRQFN